MLEFKQSAFYWQSFKTWLRDLNLMKFEGWMAVFQIFSAFVLTVIGGWTQAFEILIILMGLDYVTGLMKGYFGSVLSSERGWKGLLKKAGYLVIIATFFQAGRYMGSTEAAALFARSLAIHALIINEFLSVLENTRQIVIPEGEPEQRIPKGILDLIEALISDEYTDKIVGSRTQKERQGADSS